MNGPPVDDHVTARLDLGGPVRRRTGKAGQRERLGHRLAVLELVLGDHPDEEVVELGEQREDSLAHIGQVRAGGLGRQDRKPTALGARVRERVVELVVLGRERPAAACAPKQPQLFEVADVCEIPDQWRLEGRDLSRELLVRERVEQGLGPLSRVPEDGGELSR